MATKIESPGVGAGELLSMEISELTRAQNGDICISVIVPMHRLSPERRGDEPVLAKAIDRAKDQLKQAYGEEDTTALQAALDELCGQIDFVHNQSGIGLFVSPAIRRMVRFFFPVVEKVIVDRHFEIRDLLFERYYSRPYYILLLSEKEVRLFSCNLNVPEEVTGAFFPLQYTDDYIYTRPSRGSSYVGNAFVKAYEKDKSELEEIRFQHFLHEADMRLGGFLVGDIPLIAAGTEKDLAYFARVTRHSSHLAGHLTGSYSYLTLPALGELAWDQMKDYLDRGKTAMLKEVEELVGAGRVVTGIQEIWRLVNEGNVFRLLVEKDYAHFGFLTDDGQSLHLYPPVAPHRVLPDAVDSLMQMVLGKSGDVVLMENGTLEDYQRIVLITRY